MDSEYRFLYLSMQCTGNSHDSLCWEVSGLVRVLKATSLPTGSFSAGDKAYDCKNGVVTPWTIGSIRGHVDSLWRDSFNFFHRGKDVLRARVWAVGEEIRNSMEPVAYR